MSILDTFNTLLFFTHICALLTSLGVVIYFIVLWFSGRYQSAVRFPYQEIELGSRILGVALSSLWLSALPSVMFHSLEPERYFSATGIVLLGVLTLTSSFALYLVLKVQDRISRTSDYVTNTSVLFGFRMVASAVLATFLLLLFLLTPSALYPPEIAVLHPDEIRIELLIILALLFALLLAATTIFTDNWLNRQGVTQ